MTRLLTLCPIFVAFLFVTTQTTYAQFTAPAGAVSDIAMSVDGNDTNIYTGTGTENLTGGFRVNASGGFAEGGVTVDYVWTVTSAAGAGSFQISDLGTLSAAKEKNEHVDVTIPAITVQTAEPDYYELKIEINYTSEDMEGNPVPVSKTYKRYWYKTGTTPPANVDP